VKSRGPLDPSHGRTVGSKPSWVLRIGGSGFEKISFQLQKSRSVEHQGFVRIRGTYVRWGPRG
jgi:hypothetical protein